MPFLNLTHKRPSELSFPMLIINVYYTKTKRLQSFNSLLFYKNVACLHLLKEIVNYERPGDGDVFSTLPNVIMEIFRENSYRLNDIQYFRKKAPLQVFGTVLSIPLQVLLLTFLFWLVCLFLVQYISKALLIQDFNVFSLIKADF